MKVLVTGASGFLGHHVVQLLAPDHEVYAGRRTPTGVDLEVQLDLSKPASVLQALKKTRPDVIIHCAGITVNDVSAYQNSIFVRNILEQITAADLHPKRIITMGSAAEYGIVGPYSGTGVKERTRLHPISEYGKSKVDEVRVALDFRRKGHPVVVMRIFNAIGVGMAPHMLIPRLLRQLDELRDGRRLSLSVTRLDATRDYVSVHDVTAAIALFIDTTPEYDVYNVGSGIATSIGELVQLLVVHSGIDAMPFVQEASTVPEPTVAAMADISRLKELGWKPRQSLEEAIVEIIKNGRRK